MRKFFDLVLLFFLFFFLFWQKDKIVSDFNYLLASPCDKPIAYNLGEVDKGYGLSRDQFLTKIQAAGQIWDLTVNKKLFTYDPKAKLVVNLIYSERQSMADNLNSLEDNLKTGQQSLNSSMAEYKSLELDFEKKLQVSNSEIGNWNKLGGAPEETFNRLKSQQEELRTEADKLNKLASQLNLSVQNYNLDVSTFNQSAQNFKQAISVKPEAGLYKQSFSSNDGSISKIDIYLTSGNKELVHTLAHEMGHALGLSHLDKAQSIMYPYTNEVIQPDSQETTQLQNHCRQRNLDLVMARVSKVVREEVNKLKSGLPK